MEPEPEELDDEAEIAAAAVESFHRCEVCGLSLLDDSQRPIIGRPRLVCRGDCARARKTELQRRRRLRRR